MDSALRPRDIQARIRAGESVEDVARAAGVGIEKVEPFAGPVLAERQHVAGLALSNPVRRRGETSSNRPLRTATTEALVARGIDPDEVEWDAVLLGARRWQIAARYARRSRNHEALFVYDLNGRFSVAANDEGRKLIGEATRPSPAPAPVPDDGDELAIVRAIQPEDASDVNDAYTPTELAEVDGVYDIVSGDDPEMDALYDMLASFDEDSVKIYTGLIRPEERVEPVVAAEAARVEPIAPERDAESGQPALVPEPEPAPAASATKPKRGRRAQVPSWDEIMFGSPRQGPDKR